VSLSADAEETHTFAGSYDSLAAIGDFVGKAAEAAGLEPLAVHAVELAVDEACSNIIDHAYGGEGRGDIEVTYCTNGDGLTVILRDYGEPFDLDRVPQPDLQAPLNERNGGGLGLHFIRELMDEVRFEFTRDSGNVLTMTKRKGGVS
jgi:serine/threonine-protein kinase RsbW